MTNQPTATAAERTRLFSIHPDQQKLAHTIARLYHSPVVRETFSGSTLGNAIYEWLFHEIVPHLAHGGAYAVSNEENEHRQYLIEQLALLVNCQSGGAR